MNMEQKLCSHKGQHVCFTLTPDRALLLRDRDVLRAAREYRAAP